MIDRSKLEDFLPAYLSPENEQSLLENLSDFPDNIDSRFYGFIGKEKHILYQGDGIKNLIYVNIPSLTHVAYDSLILSNTCDLDLRNQRIAKTSMVYTPIIKLKKYEEALVREGFSQDQIEAHVSAIRKQYITQIFYLPSGPAIEESLIFFDRVCHCDSEVVSRENLESVRILSLSQYGFYLLLYKISIHVARLSEKVDRYYIA